MPTTLPVRRSNRHNARLNSALWVLGSVGIAAAAIWLALAYLV